MSMRSDCNVHGLEFREAKPSQGDPSRPVSELFRLDNRTIIITGATGFLGTTLAIAILESGGDVVCLDLAPNPTASNWNEVKAAATRYSCQLTYYPLDVTDETAVEKTFAHFIPALRYPLKGLVACAGLSRNGPATEFPVSSFRRILDINVTGTFLIAQATAREVMRTNTTGSIVFVASMSGYVSNKGVDTAGYNASKAAVHQLTRSLAAEWGSRVGMPLIRVNSLSPGYIRTAATAEALQKPGMESQWVGDNMLFRLSTVDEFRAPVLFMLGDGSSFMTGADLRVDGGHCSW
ncbi:short-chain dehydrogenase [Aspergillus ibericus CBS 121593]|uniref:Short-chain dehydrogenase n=1 Tax=Aspergillus ibericus CBS 121593 TaxID=1448316 RepID=A0A395GL15_9EURO|nr:short-chain dehydrogenase [Aspergillus ibericus CBS 121593]RAK95507.1 short-chain dehydrogenase [Aspergillus ibericus CBS 121593]